MYHSKVPIIFIYTEFGPYETASCFAHSVIGLEIVSGHKSKVASVWYSYRIFLRVLYDRYKSSWCEGPVLSIVIVVMFK